MICYVQVDAQGNVVGEYANPQPQLPGYTEVDDKDPRLTVFRIQTGVLPEGVVAPAPTPTSSQGDQHVNKGSG